MKKPGNRTIKDFIDYDYVKDLSKEDREYLEKFTQEYYAHNFGPEPLHKDVPGARVEATNRENAARRDVWNTQHTVYTETFPDGYTPQLSTSDMDFEEVFKHYGFEIAHERILDEALDDLDNPHLDRKQVLMRFYKKRIVLKKLNDADRKNRQGPNDE